MASPTDHDEPQAGEAAPEFAADSSRAQTLDDSRFIGKVPFVLVFTSDLQDPASARFVNDLDRHQEGFGSQRVQLLIVVPEPVEMVQQESDQRSITAPLLADPTREIASRYGVEPDSGGFDAVVVDREGVVVERLTLSGEHAAERLVDEVRRIVAEHPWSMEPASRD
jgi:peroxiredoxin